MNHKQRCVCGCPPRAGTCILLWWTMVWCVVGMFFANHKFEILHGKIGHQLDELFENYFYRCFIINLLIIVAIICVVGLYGVYTKNSCLLMPYIVYRTVVDILIVIGLFPLLLDVYLNPSKYGKFIEQILGKFSVEKRDPQDAFDHVFILFILLEFSFIAVEIHFIKVILSCYNLMESSARMCRNEILFLSNLKGSSSNGKFYSTSEKEISTAV